MASRPRVEQVELRRACRCKACHERWSIAYKAQWQTHDPWLEPDIGDAIRKLSAEGSKEIVVAPIGFVCDHVENSMTSTSSQKR